MAYRGRTYRRRSQCAGRCRGEPRHDGKLYAIGGRSGPNDFGAVDIYDPISDSWAAGPSIEPRATAGAVVYYDAIWLFGGESQARRASFGEVLRLPRNGTWQSMSTLPTARNFARAVVLGDAIYVVGGSPTPEPSHASEASRIVERFHIDCKQAHMSRIFVTGSADGLGRMAARLMVSDGHRVVLHARNEARAAEALAGVPRAETAVVGDLSSIEECRRIAAQVNELGAFDAVIHNAGVGYREPKRTTVDGLPHVFAINTLAPYVLTALIDKPKRLVYLSSGMHYSGDASLNDLTWSKRAWNGSSAYADSKLHDVMLAFAVARKWPYVLSNALEPGWVATKMGGPNAPDDLEAAPKTQVWLATSDDDEAMVSGRYFYHKKARAPLPAAHDAGIQERLIAECARISGVAFPAR